MGPDLLSEGNEHATANHRASGGVRLCDQENCRDAHKSFSFFLLSPGVEMRTPQSMKLEMNPTEFCRNQKNIESDAGLAVRQKLGKVFLLFFSETWMSDLR